MLAKHESKKLDNVSQGLHSLFSLTLLRDFIAILISILIKEHLAHSTLIFLVLINVAYKFSKH